MLPNPSPRPAAELEELRRVWTPPRGFRFLTEVNNNYIGIFYVAAALLFFLLAGILALLMRAQLAVPENTLIGSELYNQLFTMHGTVMMFLFAVPAVEAMGILLLPNMIGARDMPFPRLSAFAFWAYFLGGLAFVVKQQADDKPVSTAQPALASAVAAASAAARSARSVKTRTIRWIWSRGR